ncbi:TPA: alginate lyase family protein [Vibrio vulnificus]|nr:alginate lyase family protein [Vibrio vulnificus]
MNRKVILISILLTSIFSNVYAENIRFISYDQKTLELNKSDISYENSAFKKLINLANKALESKIDPVTNKTLIPASGDIHDYYSFGPYWWPNPDTDDGLPYVRRDGDYNMDTKSSATDKQRMIKFASDVKILGLAYYFTGNNEYSIKAKQQIIAWLVDPKTKMNPNMNHAQAIPGLVDGRGIGIIDSRLLIGVVDSIELIRQSLSDEEYASLLDWFSQFNRWLITSNNGFEESNWHNNHGTWYDAQVVAFSIFTVQLDVARRQLRITQMRRIGSQFDMEGKQHAELERTQPWHYSNFNLEAYNLLGRYGDLVGVDVWNYSIDNHALKNGYKYIAKYINEPESWVYKEIKSFDSTLAYENMLYANKYYGDDIFIKAVKELKNNRLTESSIYNLIF